MVVVKKNEMSLLLVSCGMWYVVAGLCRKGGKRASQEAPHGGATATEHPTCLRQENKLVPATYSGRRATTRPQARHCKYAQSTGLCVVA